MLTQAVISGAVGLLCTVSCSDEAARLAQSPDGRQQQVDALFAHFDDDIQPGAAVLVLQGGAVVYEKGFGYADIAGKRRIDSEASFRLASVSKQFTAAALLVLQEQGKLDIDDPVIDYLPEQTAYPGVTIRHLLTHTAGLPDYYDAIGDRDDVRRNADVRKLVEGIGQPVFAPGEQYEYSNSAYELLAQIVEAAADLRFADFMDRYIFEPAGMHTAVIHDHTDPPIHDRVYGYDCGDGAPTLNDEHVLNGIVGSGSMYATLQDFIAWDQALERNKVINSDSLLAAYTAATLNNGELVDYGLGWGLDTYRGFRRAEHGGSWIGFRTGIARYPDQRLTVVVLMNCSSYEPGELIDRISDIYLPDTPRN